MKSILIQEAATASKWFFRSLKKGDWIWLMIAIIIASATVTVVKHLGESVQQSMLRKASESLGADFVIQSSRPIDSKWQELAEQVGLQTSTTLSVVTMALTTDQQGENHFQLVNLKGVSNPEPLRGKLQASSIIPFQPLKADSVWVDPGLISLLSLNENSQITLGTRSFKLAGSLQGNTLVNPLSNIAPHILIQLEELKQLGLMGPGSRVNYSLSVAGDKKTVQQFAKRIEQENNAAWQVFSAEAPSEDLGQSLDTAWLFLDLSALSAVLVAGMSILIASRFYLSRWKQSIALMRAFGAHNSKMNRLFAFQMSWIAVFSSLIGVALGYLISLSLLPLLEDYFSPLVIAKPYSALSIGFISGILVLWTFAWQAFFSAVKTSPMNILKAVPDQSQNRHWLISFLLLIGLISVMLNVHHLHWIVLGIIISSLILYAVAYLLLKFLGYLQHSSKGWFKIALSNINKEPGLVKIQLISVGMVLFVLMLMTFVRQDLIQNWQASLPENTPNAFTVNIQPDQKATVDQLLTPVKNKTEAPMVRGRLVKVNQQEIDTGQLDSDRAKRLLRREANIAVLEHIPNHNQIIAQLNRSTMDFPAVSVEKGIAELFGLKLGDVLDFSISGQNYRYQIGSIREVQWQSFQLNFFFIIEPVAGQTLPITYLNNFLLPEQKNDQETDLANQLTKQLAQQTPGVLLFDVRKIIQQIQDIMNQAGWAVSALYGFTLLASIVVLFTATLASQQSRIQSWLLLRTIGAQNSEIIKIGLTEFFFLGGLAGLFAASLAQFASFLISLFILNMTPQVDLSLWLLSMLIGSGLFFMIGLVTQLSYLRKSPQELKKFLAQN